MNEPAIVNNEQPSTATSKLVDHMKQLDVNFAHEVETLREKYVSEQQKRSNKTGVDQYRLTRESELLGYLDDPYTTPGYKREPLTATYDVVIIGGGFTGLQAAARLLDAGHNNICLIEKGSDYGGTWYWNRYPGAQCDIESYIYMPMVEELKVMPTEKYARGPELRQHARAIAEKYGIVPHTLFQTKVNRFTWNDDTCLWKIETNCNDNIQARWIVPAPGPLHTPKFPGVPGIENFRGKSFHSSRWDYNYSGGSPEVPQLDGLSDKRVAVIGTGATAVQIVPRVAEFAKELYVYQRTPSSIDVRGNRPTDPEWAKSLPQGWQRKRMENFTTIVSGGIADEDLVSDGWTDILRNLAGFFGTGGEGDPELIAAKMQLADYKKMDSIRKRVDSIVSDPKTAAALKPWYNQFCKRPCFHDEYLQAFNKPSVKLVDTDGKGVEKITENGIVANGEEIEVDCIIYATGFEWAGDFSEKNGVEITGRNGLTLTERWKDGASTFHGWACHGFPNIMILTPLQSGANPNFTHNMVEMTFHLVYVIEECKKRGIRSLEPTPEAEEAWVREVIELGKGRAEFLKDCTPGYYNDEGKVTEITSRNNPYGGGGPRYNKILAKWREDNVLEGMEYKK